LLYQHILPHLPRQLQQLVLNPPSLSHPLSFLPIFRTAAPYAWWIIVILSFYIVWTTLAGVFGYFSRILRFALRIGPIVGIIAWVMANSGQGSMEDMFSAAQQWMGGQNGGSIPGLASLAGLFTDSPRSSRSRKSTSRSGLFGGTEPISSRTRSSKQKKGKRGSKKGGGNVPGEDFVTTLLNSATGLNREEGGIGWQDVVQDYVKTALAKASGLEWLFGDGAAEEEQTGRSGRRR
ncbi:hypothetical protein TREMEDRAFT_36230, partial [Tremella mesenterica DSM 1558]|uniref:uncharacterized protein n=1 Tax=Tremella mesenterica (strain ATCC 24925 / CBS 8224 / DSM 1558 / NBRC 9311 / NRRL Y-6157 / RJB 2259-6 / UBC 559-6) TaxID=578456 RepID=UPI00032BA439